MDYARLPTRCAFCSCFQWPALILFMSAKLVHFEEEITPCVYKLFFNISTAKQRDIYLHPSSSLEEVFCSLLRYPLLDLTTLFSQYINLYFTISFLLINDAFRNHYKILPLKITNTTLFESRPKASSNQPHQVVV